MFIKRKSEIICILLCFFLSEFNESKNQNDAQQEYNYCSKLFTINKPWLWGGQPVFWDFRWNPGYTS